MHTWQRAMIFLATHPGITGFMHRYFTQSALARQFCGGNDGERAVEKALALKRGNRTVSFFFLGEYVTDPAVIRATVKSLEATAGAARGAGLDQHLSIDPTQAGLMRGMDVCRATLGGLAGMLAGFARPDRRDLLMIDMEDSSVTQPTLDIYHELAAKGLPVAVTLQACLFRTPDDLEAVLATPGPMRVVRLVKGAFAEGPAISHTRKKDINQAYLRLARRMLSIQAIKNGAYPVFGTHDHVMIRRIIRLAEERGVPRSGYEFEMLYGVRPGLQKDLADRGFNVRLYLPYGKDFWPYAVRRIGENPRNLKFAWHSLKRLARGSATAAATA